MRHFLTHPPVVTFLSLSPVTFWSWWQLTSWIENKEGRKLDYSPPALEKNNNEKYYLDYLQNALLRNLQNEYN